MNKSEQSQAIAKNACLAFKQIPIAKDATYVPHPVETCESKPKTVNHLSVTDTFVIWINIYQRSVSVPPHKQICSLYPTTVHVNNWHC